MSLRSFEFASGVAAGFIMAAGTWLAQALGWSSFNLCLELGSLFTRRGGSETWLLGFVVHLLISGVIGLIYGAIFLIAGGQASAKKGATLGLAQWLIVGLLIGMVPRTHGPAPGFYGTQYGSFTVFELFFLHMVYGAIVGWLWEKRRQRFGSRIASEAAVFSHPSSPLADSLGQNTIDLENYKKQRK